MLLCSSLGLFDPEWEVSQASRAFVEDKIYRAGGVNFKSRKMLRVYTASLRFPRFSTVPQQGEGCHHGQEARTHQAGVLKSDPWS